MVRRSCSEPLCSLLTLALGLQSAMVKIIRPPSGTHKSTIKSPAALPAAAPSLFLSLPFEVKVTVFRNLSSPSYHNIEKYAKAQAELATMSLVCRGTLKAARAVLLCTPLLRFGNHGARKSFVQAFESGKDEANEAARDIQAFTMTDIFSGQQNKVYRTVLLQSVFQSSALTSLHLQVRAIGNNSAVQLLEVIEKLKEAAKCQASLVNIRIEGFAVSMEDVVNVSAHLCTFPRLHTLHLQLFRSAMKKTPIKADASLDSIVSRLFYLYFSFDAELSNAQRRYIFDRLPASLVTFAFLVPYSKSTSFDSLSRVPNLRYLALSCYYPSAPALP